MSSAITDAFRLDHHRCDHLLAAAETRLGEGDWSAFTPAAQALIDGMLEHFRIEEEQLFPSLSEVSSVAAGPIGVMCAEHAQMRALCEDLGTALASGDQGSCTGILETLHFIAQQHNHKEENVLYPMADGALRERGADIAALLPKP